MSAERWDAIVIGSGIGGLACAAALARCGRRALVLEQHHLAGGLTQTFSREGYTWDVGLHYLGDSGAPGARLLEWISDGGVRLAGTGEAVDVVHFPGDFEFTYRSPESRVRADLKARFPASAGEIDAFFAALAQAQDAMQALFRAHALPALLAAGYRWWKRRALERWVGRTVEQVLRTTVSDAKLRAVLGAQAPDHGGTRTGSFGMHAVVMRYYFGGARYPVGGAAAFARALVPVIERAGGAVRLGARAERLLVEDGRAAGVRLAGGEELRASAIVSDAGARNTVDALLPPAQCGSAWACEIDSLELSSASVGLYLGLAGDARAGGATTANHWFYGGWETGETTWRDPEHGDPPVMFVSFPSLKDPSHDPGPERRHTAEVMVGADWEAFAAWQASSVGHRPAAYERYKAVLGARLLECFNRRFPGLAPLVRYSELSTPLTMAHYTRAPHGAIYGLAATPRRLLSKRLGVRTPVKGLYLAGQDAVSPGIAGAMMGGILAAAALAPQVYRRMAA